MKRLLFIAIILLTSSAISACGMHLFITHSLPKAPVVVVPAAKAGHVWVKGHYEWHGGRYVWTKGRHVKVKANKRWVAGTYKWKRVHGAKVKVWVPGHWAGKGKVVVVTTPPVGGAVIIMHELPTVPTNVNRPPRPGGNYVWSNGYFRWNPKKARYAWAVGKWVAKHTGKVWVPGHYKIVKKHGYKIKVWVDGHWAKGGISGNVVATPAIVIHQLPTMPTHVKRPPKPGKNFVWSKGYFRWNPKKERYVWAVGAWKKKAPGKVWVPGHYDLIKKHGYKIKVWIPGHWELTKGAVTPKAPSAPVVMMRALPAVPKNVKRPRKPGPKFIWSNGYFRWNPKKERYVWAVGKWVKRVKGKKWVKGKYKVVKKNGYKIKVWVGGHW